MSDEDFAFLLLANLLPGGADYLPWLMYTTMNNLIEFCGEPQVGAKVCWATQVRKGFWDDDEIIWTEMRRRGIPGCLWVYQGVHNLSNGWEKIGRDVHVRSGVSIIKYLEEIWRPLEEWVD